jgi:hypothetical protein
MIIFFFLGFLGLASLVYIAKPELLSSFSQNFPNLSQGDIPLSLLILNFLVLAIGFGLSRDESNKSDIPLLAGGLIIAASANLILSISFVFNILWSRITPTYLIFITICLYLIKAGIPFFVYETKINQKNKPSAEFDYKKNISDLKKIAYEIQSYLIENKLNTEGIKKIRGCLDKSKLDDTEIKGIVCELVNEVNHFSLPEHLVSNIRNIKNIFGV